MHVRLATVEDIPEMHRIRMSVRENRLADPKLIEPHHYRSMLSERGRGWVAEFGGRVVGFAVADRSRSNVWALFVDPEAERRGIGRRLHGAMMEWLFGTAGVDRAWLSTDPGTRAEQFYRSAHWRYARREPNGEVRYEMSRAEWLSRGGRPHPSVLEMWQDYRNTAGRPEPGAAVPEPSAWHFCDNEADADECARLVLSGAKRATAPSVWELETAGEPLPRVGDAHVVTDWAGVAQCVIRTVAVAVAPFHAVPPEHAALEGEGDGSLGYWRRVHRDYYHRVLAGTGRSFSEDMPVVLERFEVVFPVASE